LTLTKDQEYLHEYPLLISVKKIPYRKRMIHIEKAALGIQEAAFELIF
jgi:hypothetical protein